MPVGRDGNLVVLPTQRTEQPTLRVAEPTFTTMSDAEWATVLDLVAEILVPVVRRCRQERLAA